MIDEWLFYYAKQNGYIYHISALACGKLSIKLGAGRLTKNSKIDYGVGIKLLKEKGDSVTAGDILTLLYVNDYNINLTDEDLNIFDIRNNW